MYGHTYQHIHEKNCHDDEENDENEPRDHRESIRITSGEQIFVPKLPDCHRKRFRKSFSNCDEHHFLLAKNDLNKYLLKKSFRKFARKTRIRAAVKECVRISIWATFLVCCEI